MAWKSQQKLDEQRRVYLLTMPAELGEEREQAWLQAISGRLKPALFPFMPHRSIVFETWATEEGIAHRLLVHPQDAAFVISRLESLIPGVYVTEDKTRPVVMWDEVTEIGMTSPARQLMLPKSVDFAHSILTTVQALEGEQIAVIQWIITAMGDAASTTSNSNDASIARRLLHGAAAGEAELKDRTEKLATANFLAIGRIAVKGEPGQARQITSEAVDAFLTRTPGFNKLRVKTRSGAEYTDAVNRAATPYKMPAQVNLAELAPLISWSIGTPYIAGLPRGRTRQIHVPSNVPTGGAGATVIGQSTKSGKERDIAIAEIDRMTHVHIMGPIGSGKTALATTIGEQDMKAGRGIVLIETKGDLYHAMLERVPPERYKDVIVWDLDDYAYPIGFNILKQGAHKAAIDDARNLITRLFPESGPLTTGPLHHGLSALAEHPNGTLIDLDALIYPTGEEETAWRQSLVDGIQDRRIKKYWQEVLRKKDAIQAREAEPLKRRLWQFTSRGEIRNSLGQSKSSFLMEDVVREGKILLINVNENRIGSQAAGILTALVTGALWNAVRNVKEPHPPIILFADEFQKFATMPADPEELLAQSRSYGLGMVLIHQHTGQLDRELRDAVLANARTKIVFQTTQTDARLMASEFGSNIKPDDFLNLERREALARVATSTGVSKPFTMRTKDVSPPTANTRLIRSMSRETYGRPVDEVEAEIDRRRAVGDATRTVKKRPSVGVREWGK